MRSAVLGTIGRGFGWVCTTVASLALGLIVGILPLSLLPGQVHTEFVHGQWIKQGGIGFAGAMIAWRMSPMNRSIQFSSLAAGRFIWLSVTAFALAFWPLGLAIWFNAHDSSLKGIHDMIVVGVESNSVRKFDLHEASTGWTTKLEMNASRKRLLMPGRCVRIAVRAGRLGLDWISDASPIACPPNGR